VTAPETREGPAFPAGRAGPSGIPAAAHGHCVCSQQTGVAPELGTEVGPTGGPGRGVT